MNRCACEQACEQVCMCVSVHVCTQPQPSCGCCISLLSPILFPFPPSLRPAPWWKNYSHGFISRSPCCSTFHRQLWSYMWGSLRLAPSNQHTPNAKLVHMYASTCHLPDKRFLHVNSSRLLAGVAFLPH